MKESKMTEIERINELISDEDFQHLNHNYEKTNLFDIMGRSHLEEWHSSVVCWLLDPKASHNLGTFPINLFFRLYYEKQETNSQATQIIPAEVFNEDFYDGLEMYTERPIPIRDSGIVGRSGRIDILGNNNKFVFLIENKVEAEEEFRSLKDRRGVLGQTEVYYNYVENNPEYSGLKKFYIFLSARSKKASDAHYININYQDLYDNVIEKCIVHPNIDEEARVVLENYANNLSNQKAGVPMAYTNKSVCRRIYTKYEDVFRKIEAELLDINRDRESYICKMYEKYKHLLNEISISVGHNKISVYNGKKPEGIAFVEYLCKHEKIVPGTSQGEFFYTTLGCCFEVDVEKDETGYYLISGIHDEGWALEERFNSFGTAIEKIVAYYKKEYLGSEGKVGINGLDCLRNKDGKTPNDLYYEIGIKETT